MENSDQITHNESDHLADSHGSHSDLSDAQPSSAETENPSSSAIIAREDLRAAIDGLLFVHNRPLAVPKLAELLELSEDDTIQILQERKQSMEQNTRSGLQIIINDDGVQMATKACISPYIQRLDGQKLVSLSLPALETLSVIAFKQPITKAEIGAIRGVNCDGVVSNLLEKKLVYVSGEKPVIGRPRLYSTTQDFLFYFGMKSLADLPVPDIDFRGEIPTHPELNPEDFPGAPRPVQEETAAENSVNISDSDAGFSKHLSQVPAESDISESSEKSSIDDEDTPIPPEGDHDL